MAKSPGATKAAAAPDPRAHILDSFLALLGERSFDQISLGDVAARAGVSLADLRASYGSTFDMLASFVRATDQKVLAGAGDDMDDQPARDRLFDVLMRRLDALSPYKPAIRSLSASVRRSPSLAMGMNRLAVRSQQWMLASAKIESAGLKGAVRAQGLALIFAKVLQTFVADDDPGLARTMAALDRELDKGERALGLLNSACRLASCGSRRARRTEAAPDEPLAA